MGLRVVSGTSNPGLAGAIAQACDTDLVERDVVTFPDGEVRARVASVTGDDVFIVQPTGPPVNDHLIELALLIDACRRGRAARVTAVIPYFGYARQDRRGPSAESIGAHVALDILAAAGADRVVVVDAHTPNLEAMSSIPVEMLTAVPLLADALHGAFPAGATIVAPDLGAAKLAERYAAVLSMPVVVVRKHRLSGTEVRTNGLMGDVPGTAALIVDDMVSTGGTIEAAARLLIDHGVQSIVVAASHVLPGDAASGRFATLPIERVVTTNSLAHPWMPDPPIEEHSLAEKLAATLRRLHGDTPIRSNLNHSSS
jgi:ribose-phosphate pyrophosphokinase